MKPLARLVPVAVVVATVATVAVVASAGEARADRSFWNRSRTRIFTQRGDGTVVAGGKVGDIRMIQLPLVVGGVGGGVGGGAGGGPLVEFVQARTESGGGLHWGGSCVFITPDSAGTSDLDGDEELQVLARVLDHWEQATRSCSYLELELEAAAPLEVGYDQTNTVKYREDTWCPPPAMEGEEPECYNPQAAALTTIFFFDKPGESSDGQILDADIEMNAVHFAIAVDCATGCRSNGVGSFSDLENTLTHEVGHLVGLDHTCWDDSTPEPLPDDQGTLQPSCSPPGNLSAEIVDATMYNFQDAGETKKISVEQDDIDGFCSIYPLADDPMVCAPVDVDDGGGCCSVAGAASEARRGSDAVAGAILAALALAAAAARRRRPPSPP
jgi:hypothetical protein